METREKPRLAALVNGLAAMYRTEIGTDMLEGYWLGLEDLPLEAVTAATRGALKSCKFMPAPSELRALARAAALAPRPLPALPARPAGPPPDECPTLAQCEASCRNNAEIAERLAADDRRRLRDMMPGLEREGMVTWLSRHVAEAEHWRNYQGWYAKQGALHGRDSRVKISFAMPAPNIAPVRRQGTGDTERPGGTQTSNVVQMGANGAQVVRTSRPPRTWTEPREPGEDDDEAADTV